MTPIQLVFQICDRIRDITKDYRMEESGGDHKLRAPNVWPQNLPEKLYDEEPDPADYPFVLVILGGGNGVIENEMPCSIAVVVGGYDDGQIIEGGVHDRQGWLVPAEMAWRIITTFAKQPLMGPYKLNTELLSWELPSQEQPAPLWYGIINMQWSVPLPGPNYGLRYMESYTEHADYDGELI